MNVMMGGPNQHPMFDRIQRGCEGAYNFCINNAPDVWLDLDDRLLDAVHSIENNLTRDIYRLKREK
jgi:hypothetical protein